MNQSEKFWDKQAKKFSKHEHDIQLNNNKDFVNTLKYLNINDMVLDYGCGAGIVSHAIADKVKEFCLLIPVVGLATLLHNQKLRPFSNCR